jgi:hypothetical protein
VLHRLTPTIDLEHVFFQLISESGEAHHSVTTEKAPS